MSPRRLVRRALLAAALALVAAPLSVPAAAATLQVTPERAGGLQAAIRAAAPGDTLRIGPGLYLGPIVVDRPLTLLGEGWPVVDGGGRGTVIHVLAPDVELRGLVVRASGSSLDEESSGIAVEAPRATIAGNRLRDVLFGIYLREAPESRIVGNEIRGQPLSLARRGDAIRVWQSHGTRVLHNRIEASRDVVLWYSRDLEVAHNEVRDGRYGLHFMYCDDASIHHNRLLDGSVGAFLMYSRRLRFHANAVAGNAGPSGYGIGLKDMDDAEVRDNLFVGNRVGAFLDNSPREVGSRSLLTGNLFATNDVGIRLMPNVRRAELLGNSFAGNAEQVAIAGGGGDAAANSWDGNYWSDYRGFDADGDGTGDVPYRSERLFESLADRNPDLRLFGPTPAAAALDFAARAFPLVRPQPELTDPRPRMAALVPTGAPRSSARDPEGLRLAGLLLLLLAAGGLSLPAPLARLAATVRPPPRPDEETGRASGEPAEQGPRAVPDPPLIEAAGLSKRYGETLALDDVSFTVARGEAVALWGGNGAGKTTALRALLGVLPYAGEVAVGGFSTRRQGRRARRLIGFVPQETAFPDLRVTETLELFARLRGVSADRVARLLAELGLAEEAAKPVAGLSGGRKQRLALAVALLADPPLLLLDEPTANLDVRARSELLGHLRELKARGKTIVFSSHRPAEVRALADRVLHLRAGRLLPDQGLGTLGGEASLVDLELVVPRDQQDEAGQALAGAGFDWAKSGGRVLVRVPAGRKAEPVVLLARAGIRVEDFHLEGGA